MKNFIRKIEDFICEKCGEKIKGDGYTDHCSKCLWGKHVDEIIPGDRMSSCGALMEPQRAIYEKGVFKIFYKCSKCNHQFWVKEGKGDNREELLRLTESSL